MNNKVNSSNNRGRGEVNSRTATKEAGTSTDKQEHHQRTASRGEQNEK